jgi:hypothetical protein
MMVVLENVSKAATVGYLYVEIGHMVDDDAHVQSDHTH